jgi:hypothetical protein
LSSENEKAYSLPKHYQYGTINITFKTNYEYR